MEETNENDKRIGNGWRETTKRQKLEQKRTSRHYWKSKIEGKNDRPKVTGEKQRKEKPAQSRREKNEQKMAIKVAKRVKIDPERR